MFDVVFVVVVVVVVVVLVCYIFFLPLLLNQLPSWDESIIQLYLTYAHIL